MGFKVTPEVTLSAAVATAGTITFAYPAGTNKGTFSGGVKNVLGVGAAATSRKYFDTPDDFTVALGASSIVLTWKRAETIPSGSKAVLQLDIPGGSTDDDFVVYDDRVKPMAQGLVLLQLGAAIASNDAFFYANAVAVGAGTFTLLQTTLDVPRNVIITSSGNDSGVTFTVTGKDEFNATVIETITGANIGIAAGKKAFKTITSIARSAGAAANVKIGFGDVLGLPIFVPSVAHVLKELEDDGTPTNGTFAYGLSLATVPTATTADVRGTYDPNSACDGSKSFGILVWLGEPTFRGGSQFDG